jgi:hypothetical protein
MYAMKLCIVYIKSVAGSALSDCLRIGNFVKSHSGLVWWGSEKVRCRLEEYEYSYCLINGHARQGFLLPSPSRVIGRCEVGQLRSDDGRRGTIYACKSPFKLVYLSQFPLFPHPPFQALPRPTAQPQQSSPSTSFEPLQPL